MLLRPAQALPRGEHWLYELKFDGFRGLAIKDGKEVRLLSRNGRDLSKRFRPIIEAVRALRAKSCVIDGEIVCLDEQGRPCFEDLQNYTPKLERNLFFYAFDLLHLDGARWIDQPIEKRKERLRRFVPASGPLRLSDFVDCDPETLVAFARENRLEGIVAKRAGSFYEPGKRSGVWQKFKTYQTAEFIIGGYLPCAGGIESLAVGFWRGKAFKYAARIEVYLRGKAREQLTGMLTKRPNSLCAFERVPIKKTGDTWSVGLTKDDAARFVWVKPLVKVSVRFTEWTRSGILRHAGLAEVAR